MYWVFLLLLGYLWIKRKYLHFVHKTSLLTLKIGIPSLMLFDQYYINLNVVYIYYQYSIFLIFQ